MHRPGRVLFISSFICLCVCIYAHTYINIYINIYIHAYIYIYMIYTYIWYIYIFIYIYILGVDIQSSIWHLGVLAALTLVGLFFLLMDSIQYFHTLPLSTTEWSKTQHSLLISEKTLWQYGTLVFLYFSTPQHSLLQVDAWHQSNPALMDNVSGYFLCQ